MRMNPGNQGIGRGHRIMWQRSERVRATVVPSTSTCRYGTLLAVARDDDY